MFPVPLPEGFTDASYQHDAFPSIANDDLDSHVYFVKEDDGKMRYDAYKLSMYGNYAKPLCSTNEWKDMLEYIDSLR